MGAIDLFSEVGGMPLPEAAARFAAAGVPVFPCVPGEKRPLVARGFRDATADPLQVAGWWSRWPSANIGIPTGAASGVEVVDVDVHATGTGFPAFREAHRHGHAAGWAVLVRTPSGGLHAYYPADPDRAQSSWQAARVHVDFRGDGGYIIVPPSQRPIDGRRVPYRVESMATRPVALLDAQQLRDFLDPRPKYAPAPEPPGGWPLDVARLASQVARKPEGERNLGLFKAACRMAEHGHSPRDALNALGPAAG